MNVISIHINPNLRVDGDQTMADLDDDVHGGMPGIFEEVAVVEPVSGLVGRGWVTEVDEAERTVTIAVDWSSLRMADNAALVGASLRAPNDRWISPRVDSVA